MRKVFFQTLEEAAKKDNNVFMLVADLGVKFFDNFKKIDKRRFIDVGVAEANMIGLAAGLAMTGKNVFCYSIIPFLTMRTFEQIRIDICFNNLNVKLLGAGGGLVYGAEGVTHHAIEDIAIMRALPNMTVVAPGDAREAEEVARLSLSYPGPLYIRFGRDIDPVVHQGNFHFQVGKVNTVKEGKDVCLIATGTMLYPGLQVAESLEEKGFSPALASCHTVKPIDKEFIQDCAKKYKAIFTLEEHNILGGLGSAVAEVLAESGYSGFFKRIGIQDRFAFPVTGKHDYLREQLNLSSTKMSQTILEELKSI